MPDYEQKGSLLRCYPDDENLEKAQKRKQ